MFESLLHHWPYALTTALVALHLIVFVGTPDGRRFRQRPWPAPDVASSADVPGVKRPFAASPWMSAAGIASGQRAEALAAPAPQQPRVYPPWLCWWPRTRSTLLGAVLGAASPLVTVVGGIFYFCWFAPNDHGKGLSWSVFAVCVAAGVLGILLLSMPWPILVDALTVLTVPGAVIGAVVYLFFVDV